MEDQELEKMLSCFFAGYDEIRQRMDDYLMMTTDLEDEKEIKWKAVLSMIVKMTGLANEITAKTILRRGNYSIEMEADLKRFDEYKQEVFKLMKSLDHT